LKHRLARRAINVAVSQAMARSLDRCDAVIANAYADDVFVEDPSNRPRAGLVFVGRLIQAKGLQVLLEALAQLPRDEPPIPLTIIGEGPDEPVIRRAVVGHRLSEQVRFLGPLHGRALVDALNGHRLLVVPSVWEEPFGIVALEGLACGLVPIVADSGGLPDAVGDAGVVVPQADPAALASEIRTLYGDEARLRMLRSRAPDHLARHTREAIADRYLGILANAAAAGTRSS
jgi:glycosyltransferase involved in cell wall biosynthesis